MAITRGDKILIGIVLILNLASIPLVFSMQKAGADVIVEVDNQLQGKYSLASDKILSVEGSLGFTEIEIRDGQARITQSPCLHKICVKMGWVKYAGRIAVCIPNKVLVRVTGENHDGVDAIVG